MALLKLAMGVLLFRGPPARAGPCGPTRGQGGAGPKRPGVYHTRKL
jgi:hypothetical protein